MKRYLTESFYAGVIVGEEKWMKASVKIGDSLIDKEPHNDEEVGQNQGIRWLQEAILSAAEKVGKG